MKYTTFEEMPVWKGAIRAAKIIYAITNSGKWSREFSLKDQIRRAACSISSNMAEGFEYDNINDFVRYLRIAKGSAGEVRSQLYLAESLGFIDSKELAEGNAVIFDLTRQLGGFLKFLKKHRESKESC